MFFAEVFHVFKWDELIFQYIFNLSERIFDCCQVLNQISIALDIFPGIFYIVAYFFQGWSCIFLLWLHYLKYVNNKIQL